MTDFVKICRDSYRRCHADPRFLDLFYERFLSSSEKVAEKFAGTDFARQKKALNMSLHMMMLSCQGDDTADSYLQYIAERHGHGDLDIEPALYGLWLNSLIDSVREVDTEFDVDVETAWRETMRHGIDFMISRY